MAGRHSSRDEVVLALGCGGGSFGCCFRADGTEARWPETPEAVTCRTAVPVAFGTRCRGVSPAPPDNSSRAVALMPADGSRSTSSDTGSRRRRAGAVSRRRDRVHYTRSPPWIVLTVRDRPGTGPGGRPGLQRPLLGRRYTPRRLAAGGGMHAADRRDFAIQELLESAFATGHPRGLHGISAGGCGRSRASIVRHGGWSRRVERGAGRSTPWTRMHAEPRSRNRLPRASARSRRAPPTTRYGRIGLVGPWPSSLILAARSITQYPAAPEVTNRHEGTHRMNASLQGPTALVAAQSGGGDDRPRFASRHRG